MTGFVATWAVSWMAAAAGGDFACVTDAQGFCGERVVRYSLAYERPDPIVRINLALGKSLVVEFASPGMGLANEPVVGNQELLEARRENNRLIVWARASKALGDLTDADMLDQRTNLQLDFLGRLHLLVEMRISDEQDAVERLVLDFPERQQESDYVRARLDAEESSLRAKFDARERHLDDQVQRDASAQMSRAILKRLHCQDQRARSFQDLILVHVTRLCRVGDEIHVEFAVRNRSRSLFALQDVEVHTVKGEALTQVNARRHYERDSEFLGYGGELRGVASIAAGDADEYAIVVQESGGQKRKIVLKGLRF